MITRQEIENELIRIVAEEIAVDPASISMSSTIQELQMDSLDFAEVVIKIEMKFKTEIRDEKYGPETRLKPLSHLADLIAGSLGNAHSQNPAGVR